MPQPLKDRFGRVHTSLRVSVTDRCNIRCFYCMPMEKVQFRPRDELLTFEEITRFVQLSARLGISSVRLTGGEPLLRSQLHRLVAALSQIDQLHDLALTTNGMLLAEQAVALRQAGLDRLNISLDTLRESVFQKIARRAGLDRVLAGIAAAKSAGFSQIRLNALSIRDLTETEIVDLVCFAREQELEIRFIEFMPLDAEEGWQRPSVLSGKEVRQRIEQVFGPLHPARRLDPAQPAVDYVFADGRGGVGFINPVTEPFCGDCNRLRLTAEGKLRNCLFSTEEWDARQLLRGGAAESELHQLLHDCIRAKKTGHGIDTPEFVRPARAMYQIGG